MGDMGSPKRLTCQKVFLTGSILTFIFVCIYFTYATRINIYVRQLLDTNSKIDSSQNTTGLQYTTAITDTPITLFVRMSGSLPDHRYRYYCDLFRTFVLYWPPSFGKTVIVLDKEGKEDHEFAANVTKETKYYFPDYKVKILYESLPLKKSTLAIKGTGRSKGYLRQLWSSFFIDLYTNDAIIAWMDSDTAFFTPVTKSSIFSSTKLRAMATESFYTRIRPWIPTNKIALGLPFVANFMTYFPVYIWRDTFTHCREYILKRFNSSDLEEVWPKFYVTKGNEELALSPVNIVMSYAWYFEKDRYDWSFEINSNLKEYNKKFPKGHAIKPEHIKTILAEPQTAWHVRYGMWLWPKVLVSYCLSHRAAGNTVRICANRNAALKDNLALFIYDLQLSNPNRTPCNKGNNIFTCLEILERHYNQVGLEINQGRKLEWRNIETVEQLAKNSGIKCNPIY